MVVGVRDEDRERAEHRTIVAPVRWISGQKLLTENRRSIAALPPVSSVPTTHDRDRVEVEQRQRREHDVVGLALPRARDLVGEAHDVVLREHAALDGPVVPAV